MTGEDRPTIGDLLRRARRAAGLTQEDLSERAGISVRGISDLERGVNRVPRRDTLGLLADALGLPEEERTRWERLRRLVSMQETHVAPAAGVMGSHLAPRSNLPALLDELVGRGQELADLRQLLTTTRLMTLTGPGGSGKTRLAIELGTSLLDAYPDGVYLVDLAPVRDPGQVVAAIARTVGVGEVSGRPMLDTLGESLRNRHQLLIIDNVEHVVDAAPALAELLAACPRLSLLATSRTRLRLRGEHDYPVRPLELPDATTEPTPDALSQSAATTLFVRRAREVLPVFQPTVENAPVIAEICRRLDGLPLAIELAAARVILLPPQALLQRLEQRLPLLTDGARDLPERQQSLRATIAWSYDLLSDAEQRVFRRLAVFAGGWTIEAAEAVAGEGGAADRRDVFVELSALIEHSLIYQRETEDGTPRFSMLETLREFGLNQLSESDEREAVQVRHGRYFVDLTERLEALQGGIDQYAVLDQLEREQANTRVALDYFVAREDVSSGLRLAGALGNFWYCRGYYSEGRRYIRSLLSLPQDGVAPKIRAKALSCAGVLAEEQQGLDDSVRLHEEALQIWREHSQPDQSDAWKSIASLGRIAFHQGNIDVARARGEELLDLASSDAANPNTPARRTALWLFGELARSSGNLDEAEHYFQTLMEYSCEAGDLWLHARASVHLAGMALNEDGDLERTRIVLEEAERVYRRIGIREPLAMTLDTIGWFLLMQGQIEPARLRFEEGLSISRAIGSRSRAADGLRGIGDVARQMGDLDYAAECFREGLTIVWEAGNRWKMIQFLESIAGLCVAHGHAEDAVRLISVATHGRVTYSIQERYIQAAQVEEFLAIAREDISPSRWTALWDEGRRAVLEDAVAQVLADDLLRISPINQSGTGDGRSLALPLSD